MSCGQPRGHEVWECKALRILEVATAVSLAKASARVVWAIAWARWGVENQGIRQPKAERHLDHGFLHRPTGMRALRVLLAAGLKLFQPLLARRIRKRS